MNSRTKRMKQGAYTRWLTRDAAWWQFWMPQSGFSGGVIAGLVCIVAFEVLT